MLMVLWQPWRVHRATAIFRRIVEHSLKGRRRQRWMTHFRLERRMCERTRVRQTAENGTLLCAVLCYANMHAHTTCQHICTDSYISISWAAAAAVSTHRGWDFFYTVYTCTTGLYAVYTFIYCIFRGYKCVCVHKQILGVAFFSRVRVSYSSVSSYIIY